MSVHMISLELIIFYASYRVFRDYFSRVIKEAITVYPKYYADFNQTWWISHTLSNSKHSTDERNGNGTKSGGYSLMKVIPTAACSRLS